MSEKKYTGYGYHGGGRPRKPASEKAQTVSISGKPAEVEHLRECAQREGVSVSTFVWTMLDIYDAKL